MATLAALAIAVTDYIDEHEAEVWSDGVSELVEEIARDVPR